VRILLLVLVALAAGCAAVAPEQPAPQQAPENAAVASLMQSAHADADAGRLASAEASLERALRIDPRNPRLWQQLAGVRLQQGDYAQAESLAARSNSWAGANDVLRAENWRLIAEARGARGDDAGAREALERAEHYGH
jgi:Tfp pilus assembly protein PilF